ncbi:hypothetical protein [truncated ORF], partial [Aspergillus niger]|uniref:Uncharacterized protein n=2 Tax=Aspergillus niger TaxID=5061 RepID=A0AAJ8BXV5_ASPNG
DWVPPVGLDGDIPIDGFVPIDVVLAEALTCVSDLHRMRIGEPTGKAGSRRNLENGKGHKLRAR